MKKIVILVLVVAALILVAKFIFGQKQSPLQISSLENGQSSPEKSEISTVEGYSGNVLAGSTSLYLEFNKADYDKAQSSGKIIFLDFYANWCPICRAEAPKLKEGFDSLNRSDIVGFRVNYNDSDTDDDEKALAKEFGIVYQHTKVIQKGGKEVLKDGDSWTKERFLEEIGKI